MIDKSVEKNSRKCIKVLYLCSQDDFFFNNYGSSISIIKMEDQKEVSCHKFDSICLFTCVHE